MAGVNPWLTIGVLSGSNGSSNMTPFLQSLSSSMAPLVTSDGSGGGAGGTYAQSVAGQSSTDATTGGTDQEHAPLFPTKTSKTDKNYKDPRMANPSWMGGANLFDDDSHGANVLGQLAARSPGTPSGGTTTPPGGGSSGGGSGGHHGGHGGHGGDHHEGGYGGWGRGGLGGLFGRWW